MASVERGKTMAKGMVRSHNRVLARGAAAYTGRNIGFVR